MWEGICTIINRTWMLFLDQFYARFHVTWNTWQEGSTMAHEPPVN